MVADFTYPGPTLQTELQLYFASSSLVTLLIVRINCILHLVSVFFSCISYFSSPFISTELLKRKCLHCNSRLYSQPCGSISTKHIKLALEDALAVTMREGISGFLGNGPVGNKVANKISIENIINYIYRPKWQISLPLFLYTSSSEIPTLSYTRTVADPELHLRGPRSSSS